MFEGLDVVCSAVKITRAGDGLSEALKLAPRALAQGEEVFFVLRGSVGQVIHKSMGKDEPDLLTRVHVVETHEVTQVDRGAVDSLLLQARERLARLRAEEAGLQELPLPGEEDDD